MRGFESFPKKWNRYLVDSIAVAVKGDRTPSHFAAGYGLRYVMKCKLVKGKVKRLQSYVLKGRMLAD